MRGLADGSGAPSSQRLFGTSWRSSSGGTRSKPPLAHFRTRGMTGTPILPVGSGHSGVEIAAGSVETSLSGVLLDTTALIDALRGRPAAARIRQLRTAGDRPYTCAINVEELFRGVKQGEESSVARLLNGLRLAPLGRIQGEQAGRWRRQFVSRGVTLSQADCLVAAAAVGVGARLATGNPRDFPMKGLVVDHWPVGA